MQRGAPGRRVRRPKERYRIVGPLGSGGMGIVFEGIDTQCRRRVALKFTQADPLSGPSAEARLELEAEAMIRANDRRVCTVYDVAECEGWPCLVMQRLLGRTLQAALAAGPLDTVDVIDVAAEIAGALVAVHRAGLVHQDVKPANIFVTTTGRIKLLDFGLVAERGAFAGGSWSGRRTGLPSVLGTTNYIAPERILRQPADPRSDLFSLGAVIYEMAAGRPPFAAATTAAALMNVLEKDPPPIDGPQSPAARSLDRLIRKLLEKDPAERCQSAAEVRTALLTLRQGRSPAAGRITFARSLHARGIRHDSIDATCAHVH